MYMLVTLAQLLQIYSVQHGVSRISPRPVGCLSTVARYGPENLIVIVLDNDGYETTGGQESSGSYVNFAGVAENCGLTSYQAHTAEGFEDQFLHALEFAGPVLIEAFVEHSEASPPPDYDYGHSLITNRFRGSLQESSD